MNEIKEETKTTNALVTGGSRGIGQACVLELTKKGYQVVFPYSTNADGANKTIKLASEICLKPVGIKSDVSSSSSVNEMFDQIEKEIGNVTVLVNNAGITKDTLLMRMKDDQFQDVINTNLNGVFYTMRRASAKMMRERWGRIINISSIGAYYGPVGQANYAAAKAGIIGMSRSVARELSSRNITVNVVAPGAIETAMTKDMDPAWVEKMCENIPLQRFGSTQEIASAVGFLASKESSYITGVVLPVDGGVGMGT